ncbi:MAG: aminotransferase class I/II-fold pyridoxal phosphate-dependent enzyme [Proteobacteria bacterium]|nr:aminotransferase class I/II-fold pyridoxal phosphate-dependent enzyme [Pseudomonadota bacterium]
MKKLTIDLSAPDPIPEAGIQRAVELMKSGRLFRYGEDRSGELDVAAVEREFAAYLGARYCVAFNSCGASLFVALKCAGVQPGDKVLVNAFTLAPVPGAVNHAGAEPVYIECGDDYTLDLADLEAKASRDTRVLLLSHMRGHIADMDAVVDICRRRNILLIEDCAHTMGARWNHQFTGTFGAIGCFSTQTFKHANSGEGGLLTTDDEDVAARAVLYSGSYMLYAQHGASPAPDVFDRFKYEIPNYSMRMSALAAAVLRPQLAMLPERSAVWKSRYELLAGLLSRHPLIRIPPRSAKEDFVPSSIQFTILKLTADEIDAFVTRCAAAGLHIKWFGRTEALGFTASYEHWRYVKRPPTLARTAEVLSRLCDIRIPLALTDEHCHIISSIIHESLPAD